MSSSSEPATRSAEPARTEGEANLDLGGFEAIPGTDLAVAPIQPVRESSAALSSKWGTTTAVRNYLFLNLTDKSSRTLFPSHQQLILDKTLLCGEEQTDAHGNTRCKQIKWIELRVVSKDTDRDGELSPADKMSLGFSTAEGTRYQDVLMGIDRVLYTQPRAPDTMLVVYSKGGKNYTAEIDIAARQVTAEKPLPPLTSH